MSQSEEQELISRCLQGDERAWEEVYRRHYGQVKRIIGWRRWGFSPVEVEDGIQEVFLQLVRSLPSFRGDASLSTFLTRLARNRCISHLRRKTALKRGKEELAGAPNDSKEDRMAALADPDPGPENRVMVSFEASQMARALEQLSEDCRRILRLRYYRQLSYNEICSTLGLPLGTVCSRLKRCLTRLASLLQGSAETDEAGRDPGKFVSEKATG
jgi:RNA polymerase sigma-70 factor (ECF subfamily)